jgi:hypothetical protein
LRKSFFSTDGHGLTRINTDGLLAQEFFFHGWARINTDGLPDGSVFFSPRRMCTDWLACARGFWSTDGHGLTRMACARVIVHGLTRISTDGLRKRFFSPWWVGRDGFWLFPALAGFRFWRLTSDFQNFLGLSYSEGVVELPVFQRKSVIIILGFFKGFV